VEVYGESRVQTVRSRHAATGAPRLSVPCTPRVIGRIALSSATILSCLLPAKRADHHCPGTALHKLPDTRATTSLASQNGRTKLLPSVDTASFPSSHCQRSHFGKRTPLGPPIHESSASWPQTQAYLYTRPLLPGPHRLDHQRTQSRRWTEHTRSREHV
jgi:hypothetical protein